MKLSDCFYLGYISKGKDNSSKASIKLDTDKPQDYTKLESVLVQMHKSDQTPVPFFIVKVLQLKGREITVDFNLNNLVPDTSFLQGKSVYLPLEALPELTGNNFYFHEIIGFEVIDSTFGNVGTVSDVYESAAHPVLAVDNKGKEVLIPLTDEVLQKVDKKEKKIEVSTPEGLIELYLD